MRDHQPLPQPRELAQKAECSLTNPDAVKSVGLFLSKRSREELALCGIGLRHRRQAGSWPWLRLPVERGQGSSLADDSALPFSLAGQGITGAARHLQRQGAALVFSSQAPAPRSSSGAGSVKQLCRLPWGGGREEEEV